MDAGCGFCDGSSCSPAPQFLLGDPVGFGCVSHGQATLSSEHACRLSEGDHRGHAAHSCHRDVNACPLHPTRGFWSKSRNAGSCPGLCFPPFSRHELGGAASAHQRWCLRCCAHQPPSVSPWPCLHHHRRTQTLDSQWQLPLCRSWPFDPRVLTNGQPSPALRYTYRLLP